MKKSNNTSNNNLRFLLVYPLLILILFGCETNPETSDPLEVKQAKIEDVTTFLDEKRAEEAFQTLFSIKNSDIYLSTSEFDGLYDKALNILIENFEKAIDDENYDLALTHYQSIRSLHEEGDLEDWSVPKIYFLMAESAKKEGNIPVAMNRFLEAIDYEGLYSEELEEYARLSIEGNNRFSLQQILPKLKELDTDIPEDFSDFVGKIPNPAEMMQGTVTVWVNKGIRIEGGVGYPDRVIGSGFFIDRRGFILTNYHVIESEVNPEYEGYSRLYVRISDAIEDRIPAQVVGYDKIFDLALLKVEVSPPYIFSFTNIEELKAGTAIFAIGSPIGLENTITSGIISATGRRFLQMGDALQVDAPINPGNSGGPLLDRQGNLVGIVFAGLEQFEGINFAIPSHWIRKILPKLYTNGEVVHPWLGLAAHEVNRELEITYILPSGPADKAGLKAGDVITSISGVETQTIRDAQDILLVFGKDTLIRIEWKREEQSFSGYVSLGERPYNPILVAVERDNIEDIVVPLFGIKIDSIGTTLFGKEYVVKRVYKGSIADETGLSENDPFTLQDWIIDEDNNIAILQIFIKKRKAGFLESAIQLISFLEIESFI